jgi:alpha-glucuronidase
MLITKSQQSLVRILILVILFTLYANNPPHVIASAVPNAKDLWLRYDLIDDDSVRDYYESNIGTMRIAGNSNTMNAVRFELETAMKGIFGQDMDSSSGRFAIIAGTPGNSQEIRELGWDKELSLLGEEGYIIRNSRNGTGDIIAIVSMEKSVSFTVPSPF